MNCVIKNMITDFTDEAYEKFCPLIKDSCKGADCGMWVFTTVLPSDENILNSHKARGCCGLPYFTHCDVYVGTSDE